MTVEGNNQVQLTDDPVWASRPAWSPDGTAIAFVSGRHGNLELYMMDLDGSNVQRCTRSVLGQQRYPTWITTP